MTKREGGGILQGFNPELGLEGWGRGNQDSNEERVSSESCGPAGQVRELQIYILGLVVMGEFSQRATLRCLAFFFFF